MRLLKRMALYAALGALAVALFGFVVLWVEGSAQPDRSGAYVSLGSSFAAGPKLSPRVPGSAHACWRTTENYAQQLARATNLRLVDVSCGGATAKNLLEGGPFFQPPQIDAIGESARLVTITVGGNDVGYIGDLGLLSYRASPGVIGTLVRTFWSGPRAPDARPYDELVTRLIRVVAAVRERAPQAVVVLMTYPQVVPPKGTCAALGIDAADAERMRQVGERLAAATLTAARQSRAEFLDLDSASAGHDACSDSPWVHGSAPEDGAMFHPNRAGARATAELLQQAVQRLKNESRF